MYLTYARALYSKALAFLNLKKYAEARVIFEKALESFDTALLINPENAGAWYYKGNSLSYLNRPEEALEAFDRALSLDPGYSEAWYCKGLALGYLNRPKEALRALEKVLEENDRDAGAWHYRGLALHNLKRDGEALKALSRSLEIDPENTGVLYYRGLVLNCLNRPEEALEAFEQALELDPAHAGGLRGKAKVLHALGKPEEALKAFDSALELDPGFAGAWDGKGEVLESQGKSGKALEAFEKALELEDDNAGVWNNKAKTLVTLERYGEAFLAFDRALDLKKDFSEALANRGSALLILDRYEEALETFDSALLLEPENVRTLRGKGNALFGLGNYEKALEAYEKVLSLDPGNRGALCGKGSVFFEIRKPQEALKAFEAALLFDPANPYAWSGKGNALCELGNYEEALEAYEELLGLDNDSLSARYNRGVAIGRLRKSRPGYDGGEEALLQIAFSKYLEFSKKIRKDGADSTGLKYRGLALAELDEYNEALKAFDQALQLEPGGASELNRGLVLIYMKRYEKALEALKNAEDPLLSEAVLTARGFALTSLERYNEALETFEQARLKGGNGDSDCLGQGLVFSRLGEWNKALNSFEKVLDTEPENPSARVLKAFTLLRLGNYEKAGATLKDPTVIPVYKDMSRLLLGFAADRLERPADALREYRKAVAINPKNVHAHNGLADLNFRLGDSRGALKELESSIATGQENEFSRCLKARLELEGQDYGAAVESFGKALSLNPGNPKLLLWEAYASYLKVEVSFKFGSPRYRHMLLGIIKKLEHTAFSGGNSFPSGESWEKSLPFEGSRGRREAEGREMWACLLYFTGFFYYRAGYFRKAAEKLEACLRLDGVKECERKAAGTTPSPLLSRKRAAAHLLDKLRKGPLRPSGLEWWLASPSHHWLKRAFFGIVLVFASGLLLSHPAFEFPGVGFTFPDWGQFGTEYVIFLACLFFILLFPAIRTGKEPEGLELEMHEPPSFKFDVPDEVLDELEEAIEASLLTPELMKDKIGVLERFLWVSK